MSDISANLVAASRSPEGVVVSTLNIKYGLIVHAELLRHKLFSHSVKSNRAIEPHRIRREVLQDPYIPVKFGVNQRGMIAKGWSPYANIARSAWLFARYPACAVHWFLNKLGIHKEVCNRLLNPWQWVRETITFTDYVNFFNLRIHKAAQPDIALLAHRIYDELEANGIIDNVFSEDHVLDLSPGEWHTPYVKRERGPDGVLRYFDNDDTELTVEQAIVCSVARCARSSYDNHDGTKCLYDQKASPNARSDRELYESLLVDRPIHASPAEHVATPMLKPKVTPSMTMKAILNEPGVTHAHVTMWKFSGCLRGWIAHRYLIKDESVW